MRIEYDPISGVTLDLKPGKYVLLTEENWLKIKKAAKESKDFKKPGVDIYELEVPDPGPSKCPECGIDFWSHSSSCSRLGGDGG